MVEGALDPNISFCLNFLGKIYFLRLNKEPRVERFIDSSFHGEQSSFQFASHLDVPFRRCQVNPPIPRLNVWIGYYFKITCFTFLPAVPKKLHSLSLQGVDSSAVLTSNSDLFGKAVKLSCNIPVADVLHSLRFSSQTCREHLARKSIRCQIYWGQYLLPLGKKNPPPNNQNKPKPGDS